MRRIGGRPTLMLGVIVLAAVAAAGTMAIVHRGERPDAGSPGTVGPVPVGAPSSPTPVCGTPALISPFTYDGPAQTLTQSGTPGLPTFGYPGADFPGARSLLVVPAGDNTESAADGTYEVDNAIVYFTPGVHVVRRVMYTGTDTAYVGGHRPDRGPAVIDGANGSASNLSSGNSPNQNAVWEYLTIRNFGPSQNSAILGSVNNGGTTNGNTYRYNTIGPNDFGYAGDDKPARSGQSSGGGYAINAGSRTTISHNCLISNAQGAFNGYGVHDVVITNNEIARNGLGAYPDTAGPGASPFACGCSGGGKLFASVNAVITDNYVHDNYNVGIWLDFNNTGTEISRNYIASNWGSAIMYEASYNADISHNTIVGNGWASNGEWPEGVGGGACFGGVSCRNGNGPVTGAGGGTPFSAIYVPNSSGNRNLDAIRRPDCTDNCMINSRYVGRLSVTDNVLTDNFGGVSIYTDTNRYPGNINNNSACSTPLGALDQANSRTYYTQTKVLVSGDDGASVSGDRVTVPGGTHTLCSNYDTPQVAEGQQAEEIRPPAEGMAVFDVNTGALLGTVSRVDGPTAFNLDRAPGDAARVTLLLSAYGGCGPADYHRSGPGLESGAPPAQYWDNCPWGSRDVIVSNNILSMAADRVVGCTAENLCGFNSVVAFRAGVPALMRFFTQYPDLIGRAKEGLGIVWTDNTYSWTGGGPGEWSFSVGEQGRRVSWDDWRAAPYLQDAGSTVN